jgi:glycosyltransferase involved in cell wall biosynthesis
LDEFERLRQSDGMADPPREDPATRQTKLIYLGLMEEARGVRQVIDAVAVLRSDGVPVTLDLVGDGRSLKSFQAHATALALGEDEVRFHGFVPYGEALSLVATMDAGLIPHYASESWESTIPNKLFDYMSLGLPVIASDVTPVKRVLTETGAGIVFRDRDADNLARAIRSFHADTKRRHMGEMGRDAIRQRYHFERDAQVLCGVLEDLVPSPSHAKSMT